MNPKIFKKYDIRGLAMGDDAVITPETAQAIGRAFGSYLQAEHDVKQAVVGHDNRHTSSDLAEAVMRGLMESGCSVISIGMVATPVVYWHAMQHGGIGALMITGSHLPPNQNGFKMSLGKQSLYGDQIQSLRERIEKDNFLSGQGSTEIDLDAVDKYITDIAGRISMQKKLKVVIDPANGMGGLFAPQLVDRWGHELLECIFCEPDGDYPNHPADPQKPANLADLGAKVREHGADVGIAFDGDCDRMGAVDENGEPIAADRVLALLARDMLARHAGETVVADVLSSQVLFDAVADAGGNPMMWASGHSLIKAKMAEVGALLGGEMSGHIFLGEDYYGYDDGFFAAGRFLQLLSNTDQTVSQLNASLPTLHSTPEYRPHCPDEDKQTVIDGVKDALSDKGEVVAVDGVRIKFDKGWGLLRASNTEPVLSLRFEGETEADAFAYRDLFAAALKAYPQVAALE